MTKVPSHNFTPDKLSSLERTKVLTVRDNALRRGAVELVQMCDDELARRSPAKRKLGASIRSAGDAVVSGYHFVCTAGRGVREDGAGTFRSGSWVVAESNVVASLKFGAYLALHETKTESSYRQGRIIGYGLSSRGMVDKDNTRIEFIVQETGSPYEWVGGGAGEKGYKWDSLIQASGDRDG